MNKKTCLSILCALALTAGAVSLTACTQTGDVSIVATDATEEATAADTTAEATVIITEPETTEAPELHAEDYVETAVSYEIPYSGQFYLTGEDYGSETNTARLPQLTIDSPDAKAINATIHDNWDNIFAEYPNTEHITGRADYVAYLNGTVLSLALEFRSVDTPNSFFQVYNIDVVTGNIVSKDSLIAMTDTTKEDALDVIREVENDRCNESLEKVTNDQAKAQLEEARDRTLSDENLSKAEFFLDDSGKLYVTYRYYWIAGAENYGELVETDGTFQG